MMSVALYSFAHGADHAEALSLALGVPLATVDVHRFPDGESRVSVPEAASTALIYCPLDRPNEKLVDLMLAVDALRRGGACRLVLVAPYLCYMRQDTAFNDGEAISQQAVARFLSSLFDRIVTVDAHLHRVDDIAKVFPAIEAQNLGAAKTIAAFAAARGMGRRTLIAGPDAESIQWTGRIAAALGAEAVAGAKCRIDDRKVEITFPGTQVEGRAVLLADDIVSSGGTMAVAVESLSHAGAASIFVVVTHALFDAAAETRIRAAGAREIWSTDAVPHPTNAIPLASLLADALRNEMKQ